MQLERLRVKHVITVELLGFSTPEPVHKFAKLGANMSANAYYRHELANIYANDSVCCERASSMARIGTSFREGITTTLHSDFTMAPAQPLMSRWVAVNRINEKGKVMGEEDCITPQQGL